MDRGIGGNYGYRFSDIFPMGLRSAGRGIVRRKPSRGSYKTRGIIRKPRGSPLARKPILNAARGRAMKKHRQAGYTAAKRKGPTSAKKQGSFKKAKKIRTTPSKFAKRHYDDYGSLERDHCAYIGFQRHGCKDRMWSIIGESLTKALLAKVKVYPRSYDEPLSFNVGFFDRLQLIYKRVSVPGGVEQEIYGTISFTNTTTFEALSQYIATDLKAKAERDDDNDSVYAYYPITATFYKQGGDGSESFVCRDLGESIIELYATQVVTIKNLTPNDGGTSDLDVVGVNPINGKKYEFNNFRPKLIDSIEENNSFLGAFFEVDNTTGINTALAIPGVANADNIIAHPPVPRQLFTNCVRATPISMGAGGVKTERTTFKMKHKLSTLIERIYYNQYDKGSFGGCTFFAFERKTRSVTGESRVKISFDRALHMSAHCKLVVKKTMLKHYDNNAIGAIADA